MVIRLATVQDGAVKGALGRGLLHRLETQAGCQGGGLLLTLLPGEGGRETERERQRERERERERVEKEKKKYRNLDFLGYSDKDAKSERLRAS